ncbi:MAG: permease [Candidatus Nanoarchaeia archaeon]|jgi:hypothetical protein
MFAELLTSGWTALLDYLSLHVLLCLIPAFFLSGAFNALIPNKTIFKYMGRGSNLKWKIIAYSFAAASGLILEVCSCTILPLFAGIWKKGAGFGPAITFLFAGPGITLLSTPLTAAVIGPEFAIIKLILSIIIAIALGLIMELIFDQRQGKDGLMPVVKDEVKLNSKRKGYQSILFFTSLLSVMLFGTIPLDLNIKLILVGVSTLLTIIFSVKYYNKTERRAWLKESFNFMKMIFPILLVGVFISGFIKPLIPLELIASLAGSNTLLGNLFGVLFGAIAYFPTLVEVPIAQLFLELGMHKGPLMAYLIADPAVSIQCFIAINKILKPKRTITYALLIILLSVIAGYSYGLLIDQGLLV